ncbi:hypothetical protein SCUCBS95973_003823 [Sporothrix curviconia]|uniref:C2H2-type domain-containing protein n=1 Tax=Sporothrix curviconia TaxID=1260050 RepID=A0ABP0BIK4_9PEZI
MMDLKLDFHHQQGAMYGDVSSNHGSFSSASGPVGPSYDAFTPVSMSGRSTPVGSQRLGSVDYSSNASFGEMPLEMTPPSSATMPFFSMNMPPSTAAGMAGPYMSSSAFPQPPATPERTASFSSHVSVGSPSSPNGVMVHSYPASVASMSSMTSMATMSSGASPHHDGVLCGPATPGAYPFPETLPSKANGLAGQYPLPAPYHRGYPTPHDGSDYSPSEFCWNTRPESPAINYFGERPSLPPPPPSATLKSSIVKHEGNDAYLSPTSESPYSTSPSRRSLHYMGAQSSARALQGAVDCNENHGYAAHIANNPPNGGTIVTRNGIQVSRVASGAYKCLVPGCPSRPFKRSEHLKRHVTTHHENKDSFPCEFCGRHFNRKDNWRSHLKLHTVTRGKNARTDYYPAAVRIYEHEMKHITKSRSRKEVSGFRR